MTCAAMLLIVLVPLGIWAAVLMFVLAGLLAISDGLQRLRRLHQVPCYRCRYYTGSPYLKCPVRPREAASEAALQCPDYTALAIAPRPRPLLPRQLLPRRPWFGLPPVPGGRVYLVPSSLKAGEIAKIIREGYDVGLLSDGCHALIDQLHLDYLSIDTYPDLNEETLLSIAISDRMVIILRPDRQAFLGTAVTLEVAQKLEVPGITLLVNQAPGIYHREILIDRVQAQYGVPVGGLFYENDEMLQLASGGIFWLHYPDHAFSKEVHTVAQQLIASA